VLRQWSVLVKTGPCRKMDLRYDFEFLMKKPEEPLPFGDGPVGVFPYLAPCILLDVNRVPRT